MSANFKPTSGFSHLVCVFAACIVTATLFGAVALGLTSSDASVALAQAGQVAPVRAA